MTVVEFPLRKRVDIERLLQWVYLSEMLKGIGDVLLSDASAMFRLASLGTVIDNWNHEPRMPTVLGPPHPDALLIDHAIRSLWPTTNDNPTRQTVQWSEAARRILLHGGLEYWVDIDDPVIAALAAEPAALLIVFARMGTRPRWYVGEPKLHRILSGSNAKTQYLNRYGDLVDCTKGKQDYFKGGRCPLRREPPAREEVAARFEYLVWHHALTTLANRSLNLAEHVMLQPAAPAAPWITGEERKPRVLAIVAPAHDRLTTKARVA